MNTQTVNQINTSVKNLLVTVVNSTSKTGARFASLRYTNEQGEMSRYNIIMGIRLLSLYKSDLRTLQALRPSLTGIDATACDELIASITESLTKGIGNNSAYTLKGYYESVTDNGEIKLHTDENGNVFLYVRGYVLKKTVITAGVYKKVNSSEKTLAKKKIEKSLKRGRIRTFKINVNVLKSIKVNGMHVEIE